MADSHVVSALSTKRGEILGSIMHYKQIMSFLIKSATLQLKMIQEI